MLNMSPRVMGVVFLALSGVTASAYAEGGLVENATKNVVKGMVKAAGQEMNSADLTKGVKQVTKGMVDGVADAVPTVTSQLVNQANVNRRTLGRVAREVSMDAAAGAFGATLHEMTHSLGRKGDGPFADTLTATTERVTAAAVRGLVAEIHIDPAKMEKLSAAAVRGAVSEMNFNVRIWPIALAFILGGISTLLCGVGLMLLYILFQRRRTSAVVTTTPLGASPA